MAASKRSSEEEIPAKKIKLTDEKSQDDNSGNLQSFRGFQLIKVLNENAQTKTVAVHGEREPCFHGGKIIRNNWSQKRCREKNSEI